MPLVEDDDLKIAQDQTIAGQTVRQEVKNSQVSVVLGAFVISAYALLGGVVLALAFAERLEPPTWATAIASSTVTAALAIIFKEHLPTYKPRGR